MTQPPDPFCQERLGINVAFNSGAIARSNGDLFISYARCDNRCHVATATVERMLDYVHNTPLDPLRPAACVRQPLEPIRRNLARFKMSHSSLYHGLAPKRSH